MTRRKWWLCFFALTLGLCVTWTLGATWSEAQMPPRELSWTATPGATSFRVYREVCSWILAPESTKKRPVVTETCSWVLHAEGSEPKFTVRPPFERAHWMAADVLADGTESRQTQFGWWTQP